MAPLFVIFFFLLFLLFLHFLPLFFLTLTQRPFWRVGSLLLAAVSSILINKRRKLVQSTKFENFEPKDWADLPNLIMAAGIWVCLGGGEVI